MLARHETTRNEDSGDEGGVGARTLHEVETGADSSLKAESWSITVPRFRRVSRSDVVTPMNLRRLVMSRASN